MRNEKTHRYSYAPMPATSKWHNAQVAQYLGVAVEWEEDGQLRKMYIRRRENELADKAIPGSFTMMTQALGLIAWLNQAEVEHYSWCYKYGLADIRVPTVDVLSREIRMIKRHPDPEEFLEAPCEIPLAVLRQQLTDAGADKVGSIYGQFARPEQLPSARKGPPRACCDFCWLLRKEKTLRYSNSPASTGSLCKKVAGTETCGPCHTRGLICTFTREFEMRQNNNARYNSLKRALLSEYDWSDTVGLYPQFDVAQRDIISLSNE